MVSSNFIICTIFAFRTYKLCDVCDVLGDDDGSFRATHAYIMLFVIYAYVYIYALLIDIELDSPLTTPARWLTEWAGWRLNHADATNASIIRPQRESCSRKIRRIKCVARKNSTTINNSCVFVFYFFFSLMSILWPIRCSGVCCYLHSHCSSPSLCSCGNDG